MMGGSNQSNNKVKKMTIKLGRRISEREIEKAIERGWAEAIKYNPKRVHKHAA